MPTSFLDGIDLCFRDSFRAELSNASEDYKPRKMGLTDRGCKSRKNRSLPHFEMMAGSRISTVACTGLDWRPAPVLYFGHVLTVLPDVGFVLDELIAQRLPCIRRHIAKLRKAIDHI